MTKAPPVPIEHRLALRVSEAAALAGISRSQAYALIASGEWPSVSLGGALRVPRRELEAKLAEAVRWGTGS